MNHPHRNILKTALAAVALLGVSVSAQADESLTQRVATGVGQVIAAQGNAALMQIREELQQRLIETVSPLMPNPEQSGESAPVRLAGTDTRTSM
ncbi:hypothetical protein E4T66_09015 [Sinimarinibacterium sp. CAU 1509]|uniref:hypothetical protein n=1 Tax=Sinimarinibacterium sp. CAU 1509 TaxID=2562283 RepID=UPI0010ABF133|nr:hypothetical protein [Sinimarinibacterium sp. CAU 1509]TJY60797.1 hypothetical protein E4T66_09015 [Sinimarinibacterium sp. CAU 1509]